MSTLFLRIKSAFRGNVARTRVLLAVMAVMAVSAVSFAQSTPVPITVDTNAIFTSANTWITSFTPIYSIGIGISIAFAVLAFIGYQIVKAFRSGGASR